MDKDIKISNDTRWGEKPLGPSIKRPFSSEDIKEFQRVLAQSYGCKLQDIYYTYETLDAAYYSAEEVTSYIWLTFKMKFIDIETKQVVTRRVYRLRVDIPDEVKRKIIEGINSGSIVISGGIRESNVFMRPGSKDDSTINAAVDDLPPTQPAQLH